MQKMKFSKVRSVKTPTRGTKGSAGIDFYVPEDIDAMSIAPGESVLIPSGIKVNIPEGFVLIAFNKSGVAVKKSLQVGACVIDEDYQGEIHIHLTNVGSITRRIEPGDKIVQFLLMPIVYCDLEETPHEDLYNETTDRGSGGFGSTGA